MHFLIKRAAQTWEGDYYSYFCSADGCDHSAGCNGAHPYLVDGDGSVFCARCAFMQTFEAREEIFFDLDHESCWEDDTLYDLISDTLWDRGYSEGIRAHGESEEYQAQIARWRAGSWDEKAEGPFWMWADESLFPHLVRAKVSVVQELKAALEANLDECGPQVQSQWRTVSDLFDCLIEGAEQAEMKSRAEAAIDELNRCRNKN